MKSIMVLVALFAAAAAADTIVTTLSQEPRDIGPGKVVAVMAANKTGTAQAFTVKSVAYAGTKAHTNTVASATVTHTISVAKSEYILPGSVYFAEGAGSTNGVIYAVIER